MTIARKDIDRYFDDAFGEMMPTAAVPGFRIGRAPRKVVEHRFHDEVSDQVKSALLLDSLEQISEEQRFTAISEPNFDLEAVEVPNEGPMTFEFTIEVRPEFDLPQVEGSEAQSACPRVHRRRYRRPARANARSLRPIGAVRRRGGRRRLSLGQHHVDQPMASRLPAKQKPSCEFARRSASAMRSSKVSAS